MCVAWFSWLHHKYELVIEAAADSVGDSQLIGDGNVMLPIDVGTMVTACNALKFSSHILFATVLADENDFDAHIRKLDGQTSAFLINKGSREVVLKAPLANAVVQ